MTETLRDYYNRKALQLDELRATYESPIPYKRFFYGARADRVLGALDPRPRERILDVGCGTGFYAKAILDAGAAVTATELSERYLEQAERYVGDGAAFAIEDAQALSFPDESFDKVLMTEVVEHVPDPREAVREARRVLRPDGLLVVTTPSRLSPLNLAYGLKRRVRGYGFNEHLHEFTVSGFRELVASELELERLEFANFLLPYPLDGLAVRLSPAGVSRLAAAERALTRAPLLRTLGWTMIARARKR